MSFSSVSFIVFMIAVFLIYWEIPHKFRYTLLIFANLLFYLSFGVKCLPVLLGEVFVAYCAGLFIERKKSEMRGDSRANALAIHLTLGIILLTLPLFIFKYLNFTIYAASKVLSRFAIPLNDSTIKLLAPIGVSFYTFELISYIADVYKGTIAAERNILRLFVYAGFFPNITSGPIERASNFFSQLDTEKSFDYDRTVYGLRLVLLGMLKKICGANVLKQYVDAVFGNIYAYNGPAFIVAIVLYTYEIYLDFSGYTDMARGFAYMLGFELTENFKAPYLSNGVKEFFGRWHISLSNWLKDYVYIPLGGSRCSKMRKYVNLMITMLVSGLWHGANFTFIVWGFLHGVYQCSADFLKGILRNKNAKKPVLASMRSGMKKGVMYCINVFITFVLVSFAWMFFRANSLSDAKYIATHMIFGNNFYGQMLQMGFLKVSAYVSVILIILLTIIYDITSERLAVKGTDILKEFGKMNLIVRWVFYIIAGVLVLVLRSHVGTGADFIYFKF